MNELSSISASRNAQVVYCSAPITLLSSQVLAGANRYHHSTVLRQPVDLGVLANDTSKVAGPCFAQSFLDRFLGLRSFVRRNSISDDFIAALRSPSGVGFAELLLEAILAVEAAIAFARHELGGISYAAIETYENRADLIWACSDPKLSRDAAAVALSGLLELLPDELQEFHRRPAPKFAIALDALLAQARRRRLAPSSCVIKLAASSRGVPCEAKGRQHLLLGQGKKQQHIYASMTATTSMSAQKVCADKRLTRRRLAELRLPVPRQRKVTSLQAARAAASKIGFPLVIKPLKGNKGRGITAGLTSEDDIQLAFKRATEVGTDVLVESFIPGNDYRLLVVGGRFVAAVRREPPTIVGDGESTVASLFDELNAHPYRDGFRGFPVKEDAELYRLLGQAGLTLEDILPSGASLALRSVANVSSGGVPIDVTEQVHADNRKMAERAATGVGLDVAGIDFLTPDISRSYREVGGAIIEINARPGLDIHIWPMKGKSRNVAEELLALAFPPPLDGRIPVVAVAGDRGTGSTARALDMILRGAGRVSGLTLRERSFVNGESAELTSVQQAQAPLILLRDPQIDTLVSTLSLRKTAQRGMVLEHCTVSVLAERTKPANAEPFREGLDIVLRATTDCVVIGAWNTPVLRRTFALAGKRIILVAERAKDPDLQAHLKEGYDGVTIGWHEGEIQILLVSNGKLVATFPTTVGALANSGTNRKRHTSVLMFAIAAAYGLGLSGSEIRSALASPPAAVPASA